MTPPHQRTFNFHLSSGVYIASEKDDDPFDSRRYTAAASPRLEILFVVMFEVSRRSAQATKDKMCARLCSRSVFSRGGAAPLVERRGRWRVEMSPCCNHEAAAGQLQAIMVRLVCLKTNYCGDWRDQHHDRVLVLSPARPICRT
jgi:hypothetical protein